MSGAPLGALGECRAVAIVAPAVVKQIADIACELGGRGIPIVPLIGDPEADTGTTLLEVARKLTKFFRDLAIARTCGDLYLVSALGKTSDDALEITQIHEVAEDEPKTLLTQIDRHWFAGAGTTGLASAWSARHERPVIRKP